jgi:hypothetical protein
VSPIIDGPPLSRSYGVRLPSSLKWVISITLGLLSPPTRVGLWYEHSYFKDNEDFLGSLDSLESHRISTQLPLILRLTTGVDLPAPVLPEMSNTPCPIGML